MASISDSISISTYPTYKLEVRSLYFVLMQDSMTSDDLFEDLLGDEMYNIVEQKMDSAAKNRRYGISKWGHLVHRVPTKQTNRPNSQYRGPNLVHKVPNPPKVPIHQLAIGLLFSDVADVADVDCDLNSRY